MWCLSSDRAAPHPPPPPWTLPTPLHRVCEEVFRSDLPPRHPGHEGVTLTLTLTLTSR
ncbi:Hypothetical protein CAP_1619 [Chondromyces apiculatus DSM 436]|uniref:Uncharacterized protein n=1 Tax=Chondromyces apiculatus DSM 436 TaxID=1192034 RepID=A0A017STY2_9BACT|nr:Hypothetical protein CAP_1619 [Chondromyces apiculatus DSM 436]